jgi:DNA invertase Pin-like site-specific DNA recombinase
MAATDGRPGVVLLRNSSPQQVNNARSVKAEEVARSLLEQRGITVAAVIDEQGTSGADLSKRPKAAKLVDELEAGVWAAVAVIEVSRTSRDPDGVDQRIFKRACRRGKALLLTPNKAYDFRNDADDLQYEMESMLSAQEIKKLRKRCFDGNVARAHLAPTSFGHAPFGYRPTDGSITIRGTSRTVRILEKNPDHALLMAAIGEALDVEGGLQAAAWRLNSEGWTQPNGSPWYWSQIERVIITPLYVGEYEYGRLRNKNSEDLWDQDGVTTPKYAVPELAWYDDERMTRWRQKFASKKGTIRVRPQGHARPLLGVLLCARCRHLMLSAGERGYGCSQRREMLCKGQNLSAPQAENAVRNLLADILPSLSELIAEVQAVLQAEEAPDLAAELRHVERAITARQEMEVEWRLAGTLATPDFLAKSQELQARRADLERRLQDAEGVETHRRELLKQAAHFSDADAFLAMYDYAATSEKRAMLQQLLKWVIVETNNGRGNRAKAWVADYEGTFSKSVSESDLKDWLTNLLDAA